MTYKDIILYTATWCNPCKQLKARLESNNLLEGITFVDIDSIGDKEKAELCLRSIPTLSLDGALLNDSGKIFNKLVEIKGENA